MASFLSSPAPMTPLAVGFLDPYNIPNASICRVPVHSNLEYSIFYEISKHWLLQYWDDQKLTHMSDWDVIDLTSFELA